MPHAPSPRTAQESPHKEPPTHPITTMELHPQHRTTPDCKGFRNLPGEWAVHNGMLRWDEITPGLQAIRLHSITEPTTIWTLPTDHHHLLLTVEADATITPTEDKPYNSSPPSRRPDTFTGIIGTNDRTPGPQPMVSHRHHLPCPQRPHTHLAATMGGHSLGPPPGKPGAHTRPAYPPPGTTSRPSTTRHTHPGVMGVRHTRKPTSSRGRQDRTVHRAGPDPDPAPQRPTRLHHLVGIARPRHPYPPTSCPPPPRHQHHRPPPGCSSGSHPGRGPGNLVPAIPGQNQSGAPRESRKKSPHRRSHSTPHSSWIHLSTPPTMNGRPTTSSPTQPPARTTPPPPPHQTGV